MSKATKPPRRFKTIEELDVGEHIQRMNALRAGAPEPTFERPEYREHRRQALAAAGIEDESDAGEKPIEEMTAADFDRQISDPGSAPAASAPAETPEQPEADAGQLQAAVTDLAGGFLDPTDAQVHIDRAGAQGESFTDAIGQVDREAVRRKLAEILLAKPHLRTDPGPSIDEVDAAIRGEDA